MHGTGEYNGLPSQTITRVDNEGILAGEGTTVSLLSPVTNNSASENLSQSSAKMKCYYHHKHHCILHYFDDPILDDVMIYVCDISFQYNKREGGYTEFIGIPTGTIFVATKFLLS